MVERSLEDRIDGCTEQLEESGQDCVFCGGDITFRMHFLICHICKMKAHKRCWKVAPMEYKSIKDRSKWKCNDYTTNENQLTKSSMILACFFPLTNLRKILSVPFLDADSSVAAAITSISNMNSTIFLVNFVVEVDIFTKIQSFKVCQISVEIRAG